MSYSFQECATCGLCEIPCPRCLALKAEGNLRTLEDAGATPITAEQKRDVLQESIDELEALHELMERSLTAARMILRLCPSEVRRHATTHWLGAIEEQLSVFQDTISTLQDILYNEEEEEEDDTL